MTEILATPRPSGFCACLISIRRSAAAMCPNHWSNPPIWTLFTVHPERFRISMTLSDTKACQAEGAGLRPTCKRIGVDAVNAGRPRGPGRHSRIHWQLPRALCQCCQRVSRAALERQVSKTVLSAGGRAVVSKIRRPAAASGRILTLAAQKEPNSLRLPHSANA